MRVRLAGIVLLIALLGAAAASSPSSALTKAAAKRSHVRDGRPPRDLHLEGDHWTAWHPPAPASAGGEVYVIVKGDTLWDLAKRFYSNPYLWPQLWEKNQYILDAHWIYPGDPLVTGIQVAPVQNLAQAGGGGAGSGQPLPPGAEQPVPPPEVPGVESAAKAAAPPVPWGTENDIYCSGYVGEPGEQFNLAIAGSEYDNLLPKIHFNEQPLNQLSGPLVAKVDLAAGDIVYLSGGSTQGLMPGTLFTIIGNEVPVIHPVTEQPFGGFYPYHGRLRILSVQDTTAIAEIVQSCDAIHLGDRIRPFEPEPVPLGRPTAMRPVNLPVTADKLKDAPVIVFSDNVISLGQDHVVFIDRGSDQNVTPGDVFTIYRVNPRGMPPLVLGEVAVLAVQKRSAVVKITQSRFPVYVGDRLDPK
jgi:LysM domain